MTDRFGNVPWLVGIQQARLSFSHRAEAAMTRANVAAQHEGGCTIRPALKNVGTTRLLTDGMQIETFNQLQHMVLIRWISQADTQPVGLGLTYFLTIADYVKFAGH